MLRRKTKKGQSVLEYATLIIFILIVFLAFQKYIVRGLSGRWKSSADGFGYGRQYSPNKTVECVQFNATVWYDAKCYDSTPCDCETIQANVITCNDCVTITCSNPLCND